MFILCSRGANALRNKSILRDVMLILTCFKEHDIKLACVACTNVYLLVYVPCLPVPLQRKMPIQCEEYLLEWSK